MMPQFDLLTYSSQFFWLSLCLTIFLLYSLKIALPHLQHILRLRHQHTYGKQKKIQQINGEIAEIEVQTKEILTQAYKEQDKIIGQVCLKVEKELTIHKAALYNKNKLAINNHYNNLKMQKSNLIKKMQSDIKKLSDVCIIKIITPYKGKIRTE